MFLPGTFRGAKRCFLGCRGALQAANGVAPEQPGPEHITGIDTPTPRCQQRTGRVIEIAAAAGGVPACRWGHPHLCLATSSSSLKCTIR